MKFIISTIGIICFLNIAGQQKAITESGKKVLLFDNGKWEYAKSDSSIIDEEIKSYSKSKSAISLIRSQKNNFGVWYDPTKWKLEKENSNEDAEFQFEIKKGDGYAMAITERIQIDLENLKDIALINARKAAPDIVIEKEDDRFVNGNLIKCIQMSGTATGVKFTFFGYYYSDENGTIQLVCYTGKSLFNSYQKDFEELLNGLVTVEKIKID